MGYAVEDGIVRVDRFKARGKWMDSHAVNMEGHYNTPIIHDALKDCLDRDGIEYRGYIIVCLEPYHKYSHPVILKDNS